MLDVQIKIRGADERLLAALDGLEQAAQTVRWRVANFPEDLTALDNEIGRLTGESSLVAMRFGKFVAFKDLERIDEADGHECDSCGFGRLERCDECLCRLCEDCWHEIGERFLCFDCYDSLIEEDIEIPASSDMGRSVLQAA